MKPSEKFKKYTSFIGDVHPKVIKQFKELYETHCVVMSLRKPYKAYLIIKSGKFEYLAFERGGYFNRVSYGIYHVHDVGYLVEMIEPFKMYFNATYFEDKELMKEFKEWLLVEAI